MFKFIKLLTLSLGLLMTTTFAHSAAYSVNLEWKTDDDQVIFEGMNAQRAAFSRLVEEGVIHDLYVRHSTVNDKQFPIIYFVMEADSADQVLKRLEPLPFFENNVVSVSQVHKLGAKWLDKEIVHNNYVLELTWKAPQQKLLVDQILGLDLQKVVSWNAIGTVTSAYLDIQQLEGDLKLPTYSIVIQAKDEEHAEEIAQELEAVKSGNASYTIMYLGYKLNI
ncbi:hypothetical protein [Photobacterium minamisatsumaniensis]|uniref:hypothetical protein n=1 Tax=Photobacterium minamisatsumaniensis TaxID=2910233 RepID=UPI003D13298E